MRKETHKGPTLMRSGRMSILSWTRPSLSQTGASHRLNLKGLNCGDTSLFLLHRGKRSLTFIIYIYIYALFLLALSPSLSLVSVSSCHPPYHSLFQCTIFIFHQSFLPLCVSSWLPLSLFLLAPALLEEGFVEVSGGRWVRQRRGFLGRFLGVS